MPKFRNKPIVIEAFQMTHYLRWHNQDWPSWMHEAWNTEGRGGFDVKGDKLFVGLPSGWKEVKEDYWIIKRPKGALDLCKPDVFEITFEPVSEEEQS